MAVWAVPVYGSVPVNKECFSFSNLPTNSAAMCCASAALPPFPKMISLLPFLKADDNDSPRKEIFSMSREFLTLEPSSR